MKLRYELQSRDINADPEDEYSDAEWSKDSSSPVSPLVAIANYKKAGGNMERAKQMGYEFRVVTIEVREEAVKIEEV